MRSIKKLLCAHVQTLHISNFGVTNFFYENFFNIFKVHEKILSHSGYTSYNEKLKEERNFCLIMANIQRVLKIWKLRNLTLEEKILIFKTLALSKIIFQAFVSPIPIYVVTELEKINKSFLWENSTSKIKHDTLCNDYKDGGLKKSSVFMDEKIM